MEWEWNQVTIGAAITVFGLIAYFAAIDVITSLPGNILFFGGVLTMTWGYEDPLPKFFFTLALLALLLILGYVAWMIYRIKSGKSSQPES